MLATSAPAPAAPAETGGTATGEGDIVRSEQELRVGKRQTESGRARPQVVETEPVQAEVGFGARPHA